jgi:hypothetical protein
MVPMSLETGFGAIPSLPLQAMDSINPMGAILLITQWLLKGGGGGGEEIPD